MDGQHVLLLNNCCGSFTINDKLYDVLAHQSVNVVSEHLKFTDKLIGEEQTNYM